MSWKKKPWVGKKKPWVGKKTLEINFTVFDEFIISFFLVEVVEMSWKKKYLGNKFYSLWWIYYLIFYSRSCGDELEKKACK